MKTKSALLAGIAGVLLTGITAFAGPDTWRRPEPMRPKSACCGTCLPGGTCCEVKVSHQAPAAGRNTARKTMAGCKDSCAMPQDARQCCATKCVR